MHFIRIGIKREIDKLFSKVKKKNQFALLSVYKALNLVIVEIPMLVFPHKMWWVIEMA